MANFPPLLAILACALAVSHAGIIPTQYAVASPALKATSDQILRSPGNFAQIATQSKTIATPFSSSSKSDVRVSNPGIYAHAAPLAYAAPAAYAAPISYAAPAAPLGYAAAPAIAHGPSLLGVAYSPAVAVSRMTYSSPIGISYSY